MTDDTRGNLIWRGRIFRYAPIFLWIGVIFFLSGSSGSMSETSRFIGPMLKFLFPGISRDTLLIVHGFVRKSAHFIEYAILAFFAVRALSRSSFEIIRKYRYLLPICLVAMVAAADEFNQSLDISRTGSIWDSALDIFGGFMMVVTLRILGRPRAAGSCDT